MQSFSQRKNRNGQEVYIQECHWKNPRTFALSKQLVGQSIQLLAWISPWQLLAVMLLLSWKNQLFFSRFFRSTKICLWTFRLLECQCLSALCRLHLVVFDLLGNPWRGWVCRDSPCDKQSMTVKDIPQWCIKLPQQLTVWTLSQQWDYLENINLETGRFDLFEFWDITYCFAQLGFLRESLQSCGQTAQCLLCQDCW